MSDGDYFDQVIDEGPSAKPSSPHQDPKEISRLFGHLYYLPGLVQARLDHVHQRTSIFFFSTYLDSRHALPTW